jgi:hypothetical protein
MTEKQFDHDPAGWRLPTSAELHAFIEGRKARRRPQTWANDGRLAPVDIYCYLKMRFGPPSGIMMAARSPSSENLIQWHYTVVDRFANFIDFIGLNDRTEILIHGFDQTDELFWSALVGRLREAIIGSAPKWKPVFKGLEKWQQFINPYRRLYVMATSLKERLMALDLTSPAAVGSFPTGADLDAYGARMRGWSEAVSEAVLLGTSLRMVAPVLAEAFVNLLFFLLAKDEVKTDQRLYDDFIRKQIDVRVRGLQLYCIGFRQAVDPADSRFKEFHSLMNSRNDFLHGNVDPKRMRFGEVFFDGTIPLFKDDKRLIARWMENSLVGVQREAALKDLGTVESFVEFVLSSVTAEHRKVVELVLREEQLGWREDTKRVGVLFGDVLGEFHPVITL